MNYKFLGNNLDRSGYAYDFDNDEQVIKFVGSLLKQNSECNEIKVSKYSGQSEAGLHLDGSHSVYIEWKTFKRSEYVAVRYKSGNDFRLVYK
jgi:hypothetical protein